MPLPHALDPIICQYYFHYCFFKFACVLKPVAVHAEHHARRARIDGRLYDYIASYFEWLDPLTANTRLAYGSSIIVTWPKYSKCRQSLSE